MISKATALAIAAMAAQSAAQLVSEVSVTAWDGSQRPRLESAGGDLNLHTHGDVSLNFHGRGSGVTSSLYGLVDGQESLRGDVRQIRSDMPVTCQLSEWGTWGACTAACGGVERRSRTVTRQASNNSVPCSEYRTTEDRACGLPCGDDHCGNNEKWYFLNSGRDFAHVISYTNQTVYFYRENSYPAAMGALDQGVWNGGGGVGRAFEVRAGVSEQINPTTLGLIKFYNGDYMCGSTGPVEVIGLYGSYEKEWIPARVAGTQFVFPAVRGDPQYIIIQALQKSVVYVWRSSPVYVEAHVLQAGDRTTIRGSRTNRNYKFNATGPIVVAYVAGQSSSALSSHQIGSTDFTVMVPTAPVLYGIPSQGYVAAFTSGRTTVNVACKGAANRTITIANAEAIGRLGSTGANYQGNPCTVNAISPPGAMLGAVSTGDGDGSDQTAWHARSMMSTRWLGPQPVQHAAFACSGTGVITLRKTLTTGPTQQITIQFTNGVGKAYTTNQAILGFAGWYASSTVPCMLVVDSRRDGREMTSFGTA